MSGPRLSVVSLEERDKGLTGLFVVEIIRIEATDHSIHRSQAHMPKILCKAHLKYAVVTK